jgi:AhpC/TSA family
MRRVYAVFGALGISIYLGHLADVVFKDSLLFPFALSLIGIAIIAAVFLSLCLGFFPTAAWAALKMGDVAPDFTVDAALGGKEFKFSLAEPLKRGPVVLYFYPKSFTSVCTIEAHEFAESIGNFTAAGASVTQRSRSKNSAAMDRCYDLDRTLNSTRSDRR